ncbi:uncharacterized protein LOC127906116 isoform X4 [Oncorhynchus keta]|uniref:uncharacterized protein LOC127906116 isoform X3 n=1 Tax=Oncorhynchus keta TaxID=8018 RepID=UPI00227A1C6D|nr:uncharacterized protein LOC127906116 isoform X3 [Oncorhynchus keta]XP_052385785.1 uncharacterized protein LOC127906116 isoform X3 [Oncorhynchus keta]XP_052385786.1 uncharacterized protein LOC127906116 isoform X3 [Oncorhynchus keta]XP_052385787.1 uncharacterized protein LOC127906116 isoform X3 [Oncorhynchus keta]XP_052385788.1 uncharacterized protein LOC127906116 isoform X4 [Oncorhynchus keta]XP_052385789.1 uncharacterized protein LOC127906116 isoform X4 [Oncorhynchus keta]XP_052385790.1 un
MDRSDERIRRALRRRPYVLNPVRVNSPDSVMWPTGKVHRRPRPSTSAQTPQIHKRPPIIENCGQEQTSGDGRDMNSEPLSQSGRVTRLMERNYDGVISSSNSDDISIYSFTDCESESDEDHERRTPPLIVKDKEDGKVTKFEVREMVEDDNLSLHSLDDSDFLIIVAKPNILLPASVSALKKASRLMELVPTVQPCREQLDKKTQWTNTNEESLRRIKKKLASIELDLEEGLNKVNDGQDINHERQKNEGCFRAWIEKWMGRRKEERLRDEDVNRQDKGRMGEEVRALIQVMKRNCSESDLEAVNLDSWLNDLERLKVAFKKCTGEMAEMVESMAEMQTRIAESRLLKPEKNNYVQSFSPGKVSGPVSGLSPLVTSAPRTLAEALQALPSAVARPSQKDVPKPPTPPSPVSVIVASPAVEYLPYHRSPRLAPITNLSENGRKLLQKMSGVTPQERKVKRKKTKGKKQVKKEKASKMQQVENVGERKEDKKEEKKSLRKRFLQWLLPKLRCSKK